MKILRICLPLFLLGGCGSIKMIERSSKHLTTNEKVEQQFVEVKKVEKREEVATKKIVVKKDEKKRSLDAIEFNDQSLAKLFEKRYLKEKKEKQKRVAKKNSKELNLDYSKKTFKFWLKYFTKRERLRFVRHMRNGDKYKTVVQKILKSHGLPEDLFYVGLIESGFNSKIRSHANAVGPWQFVKGTGRQYGLRIDSKVDERYNIYKSTEAASRYFIDLYNIFGSWELALCGYNAGPYRMINAIIRGNTRNYRKLAKKRLIPKETIYYVSKIAAARRLDQNRRKYRFPEMRRDKSIYDGAIKTSISKTFRISELSKRLEIPIVILRALNPDLKRRRVVASRRSPISLYVPKNSNKKYLSKFRREVPKRKVVRRHRRYKVRKGDSLIGIAKRFKIPLKRLKRANRIKRSKILIGQRLTIPRQRSRNPVKI